MPQTNLRLTLFEVRRLTSMVGQGSASPHQISTFFGDSLGMIGTVIDPLKQAAANDDCEILEPAFSTSWLNRAKTSFGLRHN